MEGYRGAEPSDGQSRHQPHQARGLAHLAEDRDRLLEGVRAARQPEPAHRGVHRLVALLLPERRRKHHDQICAVQPLFGLEVHDSGKASTTLVVLWNPLISPTSRAISPYGSNPATGAPPSSWEMACTAW